MKQDLVLKKSHKAQYFTQYFRLFVVGRLVVAQNFASKIAFLSAQKMVEKTVGIGYIMKNNRGRGRGKIPGNCRSPLKLLLLI